MINDPADKEIAVEIVLPVYNEERCLLKNTLTLYDYLNKTAAFAWHIIIFDNGSTDKTAEIGKKLSSEYKGISYKYTPKKGRGYALKEAFLNSNADIVSYMDIDLSADLRYFDLLIEGVRRGFDISIGSRVMEGAAVERGIAREIISRIYNIIVRWLFFNKFSDGQCGFKALRADVARKLVPLVNNNRWFFDTELLLIAEHNKCRIYEAPLKWKDDPSSKVNLVKTVLDDLAGLLCLRLSIHKRHF